jgi:hypothetical protein
MTTNADITVFNRYRDENGEEQYRRRVLYGVYWSSSAGAVVDKTGFTHAQSVKCIVPYESGYQDYLPPLEYEEDPEGHWTIGENDCVVKGVIATDYDGVCDIEANNDYVMRPLSATVNDKGSIMMHHISIIGV